jgi:prepilin-type N-terminal cleavage/methylation domain-containing protein
MKQRAQKIRAGCTAFTLTEVMVAVGVIGILFLTLYACFASSFKVVQSNRENLRATQILLEKMEMLRLYNWAEVTNSGYIPLAFTETFDPTAPTNNGLTYTGSVTIANPGPGATYSNDMRLITVRVQWTSSSIAREREMSTYVSRYGLQNYIY